MKGYRVGQIVWIKATETRMRQQVHIKSASESSVVVTPARTNPRQHRDTMTLTADEIETPPSPPRKVQPRRKGLELALSKAGTLDSEMALMDYYLEHGEDTQALRCEVTVSIWQGILSLIQEERDEWESIAASLRKSSRNGLNRWYKCIIRETPYVTLVLKVTDNVISVEIHVYPQHYDHTTWGVRTRAASISMRRDCVDKPGYLQKRCQELMGYIMDPYHIEHRKLARLYPAG